MAFSSLSLSRELREALLAKAEADYRFFILATREAVRLNQEESERRQREHKPLGAVMAARELKVSDLVIRDAISSGRLRAVRVGKRLLIQWDDLIQFAATQTKYRSFPKRVMNEIAALGQTASNHVVRALGDT